MAATDSGPSAACDVICSSSLVRFRSGLCAGARAAGPISSVAHINRYVTVPVRLRIGTLTYRYDIVSMVYARVTSTAAPPHRTTVSEGAGG
ncbi:hypothetical protein GCM10010269_70960 [Streptomyces humidus]|uniref:Uncharacterized protein n=1 Tax=Streptomyces humidus TaxID=52259 RepID=A0A918G7F9_9ACTN|nr:hypothetical protein GCM10010269_70960 [Streptomyces humidus]